MFMLSGCRWDGQAIPEIEESNEGRKNTIRKTASYGVTAIVTDSEDKTSEDIAKEVFCGWLELLAEGDIESADAYTSKEINETIPELRLFNTDYPGRADTEWYAPSDTERLGSEATGYFDKVTLRTAVTPEDDDTDFTMAEVVINVCDNGNVSIESITETETSVSEQRTIYGRAMLAYFAAKLELRRLDYTPESCMHHMEEGSDFTEAVRRRTNPREGESFSIAVREGKIMYVSWGEGSRSQRYPKAPASEELIYIGKAEDRELYKER